VAEKGLVAQSAPALHRINQAPHPLLGYDRIDPPGKPGGLGLPTRRIDEGEGAIEAAFIHQRKRLLEVPLGLAWKAHDQIRGQRQPGNARAESLDQLEILAATVATVHSGKYAVAARLSRQMEVFTNGVVAGHDLDQPVGHVFGMRGHEAHPLDAFDGAGPFQKVRERILPGKTGLLPICVDVLPQKGHLAHSRRSASGDLSHDVGGRPRRFGAPHVGHDAIGTEVAAPGHDLHPGRRTGDPRPGEFGAPPSGGLLKSSNGLPRGKATL
jgi:hypothetical protein